MLRSGAGFSFFFFSIRPEACTRLICRTPPLPPPPSLSPSSSIHFARVRIYVTWRVRFSVAGFFSPTCFPSPTLLFYRHPFTPSKKKMVPTLFLFSAILSRRKPLRQLDSPHQPLHSQLLAKPPFPPSSNDFARPFWAFPLVHIGPETFSPLSNALEIDFFPDRCLLPVPSAPFLRGD